MNLKSAHSERCQAQDSRDILPVTRALREGRVPVHRKSTGSHLGEGRKTGVAADCGALLGGMLRQKHELLETLDATEVCALHRERAHRHCVSHDHMITQSLCTQCCPPLPGEQVSGVSTAGQGQGNRGPQMLGLPADAQSPMTPSKPLASVEHSPGTPVHSSDPTRALVLPSM